MYMSFIITLWSFYKLSETSESQWVSEGMGELGLAGQKLIAALLHQYADILFISVLTVSQGHSSII